MVKQGNWTEDRHKVKITAAEFDAEMLRLQAEHSGEALNREELDAMLARRHEAMAAAGRHAETLTAEKVGA